MFGFSWEIDYIGLHSHIRPRATTQIS